MKDLEQRIKAHYESRAICPERAEVILAGSAERRSRGKQFFAAAAAVMLVAVVVLVHQQSLTDQQTRLVLREAAMNHSTKLDMDIQVADLTELGQRLQKLPFSLALPSDRDYSKLALVGGRYCTISGNLAAHLKFTEPNLGTQYSLFLTADTEALSSISNDADELLGARVKLWRENGVLYAMAQSL